MHSVAVIGGGPAGLMAAEVLAAARRGGRPLRRHALGGPQVPAGRQGRAEPHALRAAATFRCALRRAPRRSSSRCCSGFGADALRDWAHGLGIETFVGSSGRVFPTDMKAAPLLRAWLHRLRGAGVQLPHAAPLAGLGRRRRAALRHAAGRAARVRADAVVLALGGGSWARLGSDGAWVPLLRGARRRRGAAAAGELRLRRRLERALPQPLRRRSRSSRWLRMHAFDGHARQRQGEFVVTAHRRRRQPDLRAVGRAARRDRRARARRRCSSTCCPTREPSAVAARGGAPARLAFAVQPPEEPRRHLKGVKAALLREAAAARGAWPTRRAWPRAIKALPLR